MVAEGRAQLPVRRRRTGSMGVLALADLVRP